MLSLALAFSLTSAGEEPAVEQLQRAIRELKARLAFSQVQLDDSQRAQLQDLVRQAREIAARYMDERDRILAEQEEAFTAFLEEDLRNTGFTPEVEGCTHRANDAEKALAARMAAEINPLGEQARELLGLPCPEDRAAGPGAELRRIRQETEPKPSREAYMIASDTAAELVGLPVEAREPSETEHTIRHLRDDINIVNLTNGLHFSEEQLVALIAALQQLEDARRVAYEAQLPRIEQALETARELSASESLDPRRIQRLQTLGRVEPARAAEDQALGLVLEALTPAQKDVIRDYKPCLVPPKDLKDPVRVGQANDNSHAIRLMEQVRDIPDARWHIFRDRLLERALSKIEERAGRFPDAERADVLARFGELADRVRGLSDVDFLLQGDELAEETEFLRRDHQLEEALDAQVGAEEMVRQKTRQNLLHPRVLPVLQHRLDQIRNFEVEPVDLEHGPIAPSCRDGRCAIDSE